RFEDLVAYLQTRTISDGRSIHDALAPEALMLLREHRWEGNFRELINFVDRLPRDASHFDLATCKRALSAGALRPLEIAVATTDGLDWIGLGQRAAEAFVEDHGTPAPRSWDEVKTFVEGYLKPILFAHLSGADGCASVAEVELRAVADRLRADRGTASKQIDRFFARFRTKSAE
ncbi:MAG: Positive regulator of phenol hydroxylase, DmpR, partial [bacterium]|nr:Positive regulator of phenol hydroxylase, DmpR [bacterium]